jgi:hypothetical protein
MMDEIDNEDETILVGSLDDIGRAAAKMENNDGDDQVKVTLFVEGLDDQKFWDGRVDETKCTVIQSGGKKHVIENVGQFTKEEKVVLGIVDDDFDSLEGKVLDSPNLIATETHDLECLLLRSRAFEKILIEYADDKKIKMLEETEGRKIREALLARGVIFGRLRWLSVRNKWGLYGDYHKDDKESKKKFEPTKREHIVDEEWVINESRLLEAVIQELIKLGHSLTEGELENLIASLPQHTDLWKVCHGHELIKLFAIALQKKLASSESKKGGLNHGDIPKFLRQSIDSTDFFATELAKKIQTWEHNNQPYQIFRACD